MQGKNRKSPVLVEPRQDFFQKYLQETYFFLGSAASS